MPYAWKDSAEYELDLVPAQGMCIDFVSILYRLMYISIDFISSNFNHNISLYYLNLFNHFKIF